MDMIRGTLTEKFEEHPLSCLPYTIVCYNNSLDIITGFTPYEIVLEQTNLRPSEKLFNQKLLVSKYNKKYKITF